MKKEIYEKPGGTFVLARCQTFRQDAVGYTINANGWRTAIARPGGKNDTYTYDTTGQVLTATAASTAGPTTESFAYDLASNRTSSTASPPDGVQADTPITYAANSLDQYTSLNGQAQTHDANGNTLLLRQPTQDDVTFAWDSENRMLAQERAGADPARIVNHYDALHRRVRKEVYEKQGGNWVLVKAHTFIYDGWNVIEERQFNAGGTLTALTRLTWGADLSGGMQGAGGVGGLLMAEEMDLADIDPPVAHYYWYDGNGNVTGITDDTGAIEGNYRYTSFGALAESTTTTPFAIAQPWKFSTKYHDPEVEPVAGTYYYGYRSYLPSVGRWLSRDPIEERGGVNLCGFVNNSPIGRVDINGLFDVAGLQAVGKFGEIAFGENWITDFVQDVGAFNDSLGWGLVDLMGRKLKDGSIANPGLEVYGKAKDFYVTAVEVKTTYEAQGAYGIIKFFPNVEQLVENDWGDRQSRRAMVNISGDIAVTLYLRKCLPGGSTQSLTQGVFPKMSSTVSGFRKYGPQANVVGVEFLEIFNIKGERIFSVANHTFGNPPDKKSLFAIMGG